MESERALRTVEIDVGGDRLEDALAAALEAIVAQAQGDTLIPERGSLSLPFSAEGLDIPGLLSALAASLLDAVDQQGEAVSAVTVAGVLATDRGHSAWGYATVARGTPVRVLPVALSAPVLVTRHGHRVEIKATATVG